MSKGKRGTSMGGVEKSLRRRRREAKRRRGEEQRWASLSGPVTVSYRSPVTVAAACAECGDVTEDLAAWPGGPICIDCVRRHQADDERRFLEDQPDDGL